MNDEELKQLAERFTSGELIDDLAEERGVKPVVIKRLLKVAKATFPDLDWTNRVNPSSNWKRSLTADYVDMKSGKPGTRGVPQGSIVKERK